MSRGPFVHDRLLAFGLSTDTGRIVRAEDGQHVVYADHCEAAELASLLERGVAVRLAARVIEVRRIRARSLPRPRVVVPARPLRGAA